MKRRTSAKSLRSWTRRDRHIDRGDNAFMPDERMREIRWEEALARSILRREGHNEVWFRHVHFHCRGGCCLGTILPVYPGNVRMGQPKR